MEYEEAMSHAKQEYELSLWDAKALREYTRVARTDAEVTAILERVTSIYVKARTKLAEDTRQALATLGDNCG